MKFARPFWLTSRAFILTALALVLVYFLSFNPFARVESNNIQATATRARELTRAAAPLSTRGAAAATPQPNAPATLAPPERSAPATAPPEQAPTQVAAAPAQPTQVAEVQPPALAGNVSEVFQQGIILRRNGDYVRAATAFRTVLQHKPDPALARQAQFRLGEAHYLAGDFTNALPALDALLQPNGGDNFAARAHYFLGDIYTQRQQYDNALNHLRAYRGMTRALAGSIDEEIAGVLLAAGNRAGALEQYNAALQDPTLLPARRVAILIKMADVHRGRNELDSARRNQLAAARLSKAFEIAPDHKTRAEVEYRWGLALNDAGQSAAAIEHWQHALAAYTNERGAYDSVVKLVELGVPEIDELQRGIADYYAGKYDLAIQAFRRYIAARDVPGAEPLYYAALAYRARGDLAGALRNYQVILQAYPQDQRVPDALYGKAVALGLQGNPNDALAVFRQLAKSYPAYDRTADGWWQLAQSLDNAQQYSRAAPVYQELAATFPNSGWSPAALFNAGLAFYFAQDPAHARAAWKLTLKNYPASQHADSAAYWLGQLARVQGDAKTAENFFRQAAAPPRTYYSWRALDALGEGPAPTSYDLATYSMTQDSNAIAEFEQWLAGWSGIKAIPRELPAAVRDDPYFKRGSELAELDRALEARPQFAAVNERFKDDPRALYALALFYRDANYFSLSIAAADRLARLSGQADAQLPLYLRQLIYPTYYADLIVPYAQRHGFDPALFFGLVRQESNFNPLSYSSAAARGLTQVIPGTGDLIARALKVQNFRQDDLFKPYVSVRFGTYYLGIVLDQFNGNAFYALMGYNGGPGNARKWQRPDLDTAVENITLSETHLYVRTVYAQYRQYVEIYRGMNGR